jgi:hypothetical protein
LKRTDVFFGHPVINVALAWRFIWIHTPKELEIFSARIWLKHLLLGWSYNLVLSRKPLSVIEVSVVNLITALVDGKVK